MAMENTPEQEKARREMLEMAQEYCNALEGEVDVPDDCIDAREGWLQARAEYVKLLRIRPRRKRLLTKTRGQPIWFA